MAEVNSNTGKHRQKSGVRRSKKLSTKVDLTPMVDLGFLLITFFIFTTSMTQPKAMRLYLPAGETHTTPYGESTVLTVIPVSGNKVFYYHGDLASSLKENLYGITNFSPTNGIGDIIRIKQTALEKNPKYTRNDLMLIIKPSAGTNYQNIIHALDEALINNLKHYTMTDLNPIDHAAMTGVANVLLNLNETMTK